MAPLAEMLRLNGYSTGFFGKNHETAAWEVSPSGPTNRWPTRSGFDKFYGFMGGETDQWAPTLYDGVTLIGPSALSQASHMQVVPVGDGCVVSWLWQDNTSQGYKW